MKIKCISKLTVLSILFVSGIAFGDNNFCSECGAPLRRVKEKYRYRPCYERIYCEDSEYKDCCKDKEFCKDKVKYERCSKDKKKKDRSE